MIDKSTPAWFVQHLRFTAFATLSDAEGLPQFPKVEELICALLRNDNGFEPEVTSTSKVRERFSRAEALDSSGKWVYRLDSTSIRFDFIKVAHLNPGYLLGELTQVKPLGPLVREFVNEVKNSIVGSLPEVNRIAFGIDFQEPHISREAAYHRLDQLIEGVRLDSSSSEFMYRINRPARISFGSSDEFWDTNNIFSWDALSVSIEQNGVLREEFRSHLLLDLSTKAAKPTDIDAVLNMANIETLLDHFGERAILCSERGDHV